MNRELIDHSRRYYQRPEDVDEAPVAALETIRELTDALEDAVMNLEQERIKNQKMQAYIQTMREG